MRIFLCTMLLVTSLQSFAGQTGEGPIKNLLSAYGGWLFAIDHTNNNPESCSKSSIILLGHSQQDQIFSLILTAYTTGKSVVIYTSGCDSNGYNIATGIYTSWNNS